MNPPINDRELIITRDIKASPSALFRAWTEPELLKQWFAPLPYTTPAAELDPRPGGSSLIVMRGPDGTDMPHRGVYLEVVKDRKIVSTNAYTSAWIPAEQGDGCSSFFMTLVLTFDDLGNGMTRYTARALHWKTADREAHEKMGFHQGWGICTDQLAKLAAGL